MNSRRPSKPNLPSAPKPSKLLAPTRLSLIVCSLASRIPQYAHCINQVNWLSPNCFPSTKIPPHWYRYGEIRIWQTQGYVNEEGESREIWRIKYQRLWMSQSCFSLEFLSQNSLWKLSTFREYKGIYSSICEECEKSFFCKTRHSSDSVSQVGWVAS